MERFYELFCLFCRGILFLVTIRKQLTLERSNGFAAGSHVAAGLGWPDRRFPMCQNAFYRHWQPLCISFIFFSPDREKVRESRFFCRLEKSLSTKKRSSLDESIIFRQKLKVGWIDERSSDRQLPYSLWGISVKPFGEEKDSGSV